MEALEEHKHIMKIINPDTPLHKNHLARPVARDAVGVFDHSGLLQCVGAIEGLNDIMAAKANQRIPVHFIFCEDIPDQGALNPFKESAEEQLPLLLQHLYQEDVRRKIEDDLGISLTALPLRSQIHLLRFLSDKDVFEWGRIKSIFRRNTEAQPELAISFFVCAEDKEYGNHIIELVEKIQTQPELIKLVFAAYDQILAQAYADA